MHIFKHHAPSLLFNRVKQLGAGSRNSWRCIYVNVADKEEYSHSLRTHFLIKPIVDKLADSDGYIFLCDDGDIFILFQGALRPIAAKLAAHFSEFRLEMPTQGSDQLFTIFDLSQHWQAFYALCAMKFVAARASGEAAIQFARSAKIASPQPAYQ